MPTSHGRSEAFSTGSHAQKPPHPSTWYDHHAPSTIPIVRNVHTNRVHLRVSPCQSSSTRPVTRDATAKAKGRVKPTRPR